MKKILLILTMITITMNAQIHKEQFVSLPQKKSQLKKVVVNLTGSVISDNQKMITSRYMGYIKTMAVAEGDIVEKGDLLYEIDSKEIESAERQVDLAISQARIALQMNRNQHNNILLNLGRNKRLFDKKMVSKYEFEMVQLAEKNLREMVKISQEQVKQAQAKRDEVLNQYEYLVIKAPNDGVIVSKKLNEGEMAMPGTPALILTDLSDLKIISEISERQLKDIYIGMKLFVTIPSIGFESEEVIESIIPCSNPMTHKFKIKISLSKKSKSVYPGMYTKLHYSKELTTN